MLQKDCDLALIQEITGASKEDIAKLKKEIEKSDKDASVT